jgi:hypothetical protein
MTKINYSYQDTFGPVQKDLVIPFSVTCYNSRIHDRSIINIKKDLKKGIPYLVDLANILMNELPKESGSTIVDACGNCNEAETELQRNKKHHMKCCTHYYNGLILLATYLECRKGVKTKIKEQGLEGPIDVDIITKNTGRREWKVAARYKGNSTDLYEVKVKKDGTVEHSFFEGDNNSIDQKLNEFFS